MCVCVEKFFIWNNNFVFYTTQLYNQFDFHSMTVALRKFALSFFSTKNTTVSIFFIAHLLYNCDAQLCWTFGWPHSYFTHYNREIRTCFIVTSVPTKETTLTKSKWQILKNTKWRWSKNFFFKKKKCQTDKYWIGMRSKSERKKKQEDNF